ncbi:MAG: polymer-forming cytoskeletal protein [Defluviitaleaceae bacterium]|nr:polymer-forming cytoskeletal protein [Defluviitaleaceae bacterium]
MNSDEFNKPTSTVIGNGFTIHAARLTCSENESMRVDGTIIGDIEIEGLVSVSETGRVDGNISSGSARVAGQVFGNVECRNTIHLAATADVSGNVITSTLIVDDGAIFTGRCQTHLSETLSENYS